MDTKFDDADFQELIVSQDADSNRSNENYGNGSNSFSLSVDEMLVSHNKIDDYKIEDTMRELLEIKIPEKIEIQGKMSLERQQSIVRAQRKVLLANERHLEFLSGFQEWIVSQDADSNRSNESYGNGESMKAMNAETEIHKKIVERQQRLFRAQKKVLLANNYEHDLELLSGKQISQDKAIDIDLKSLSLKDVEDELENRPKKGAIYEMVTAGILTSVYERLEFLSNNDGELSIDEANEIYDTSVFMKVLGIYDNEIHLAGQIAHNGVLLILQGQMLEKKGRQQLALSKSKLPNAGLK